MTSFDNNEDKVCSLLENDVGGSRVKSRIRLYDPWSCDYGIAIAFLFGVNSNKQLIV